MKTRAMSSFSVETNPARVVKWGWLSPLKAMKVTWSRQAASMSRLADDALAVGEQDDLEQHGGRIGGSAGGVVIEPGIEAGQVELVIDEVIERVFEGAGKQLPLQVNGKETGAGVDVFVAGHAVGAIMNSMTQC